MIYIVGLQKGYARRNGYAPVLVLGTGGTAASTRGDNGLEATMSIHEMFESVPHAYDAAGGKDNVRLVEFSRMDSTTMTYLDRVRLAREILEARREGYGGFAIIHGTDKMANTAAKLSFLYPFKNFPVVLTGSMIPLAERDSDLPANLVGALQVAAGKGPPVTGDFVYFNGRLLRGNRAVKIGGPHVFDTPNYSQIALNQPNLVHRGVNVEFTKNGKRMQEEYERKVETFSRFADELFDFPPTAAHEAGLIELSDDSQLDFDQAKNWKGVVIKSWGEGGVTQEDAAVIREWCKQGKIVVIGSRVIYSHVDLEKYAVGRQALNAGAIGTLDMAPDTAYEKVKFAIGTDEEDTEAIKRFLITDFVGEITPVSARVIPAAPAYQPMSYEELGNFLDKALGRKKRLAIEAIVGNDNDPLHNTGRPEISRTG